MKVYVTIIVGDDVRPIYIGKSKKKAEKIAKENEDIEKYIYCYISYYDSKDKRGN